MTLVDTGFLSQFPRPEPQDYVDTFTKYYNVGSALPWSAQNRRARAIEDYQLAMKEREFAARMAANQQEMAIKQALLPYQIARQKQLARGASSSNYGYQTNADQEIIRRASQFGLPQPETEEVVEVPLPEEGMPKPLAGASPSFPYGQVPDFPTIPDQPAF